MKIVIASFNPVKIQAVANAFSKVFPNKNFTHTPVSVPSGVPDQPISDSQTKKGSINRTANAKSLYPSADFWIGLEGGIHQTKKLVSSFAWITIANNKLINSTRTASFNLPQDVAKLIGQGLELGEAMDAIHARKNSKQQEGAVGILTNGIVSRTDLYQQSIILTLIPFIDQYQTDE